MKREKKQKDNDKINSIVIYIIYFLILIIIFLLVTLTKNVLNSLPEEEPENSGPVEKFKINLYPNVNDECTFKVSLKEYKSLTMADCEGGYTRYDINDINIDNKNIPFTVIYSDKGQNRTGVFVKDSKVITSIDKINDIVPAIIGDKLFIYDKNSKEPNALSFNSDGEEIYNLKQVLEKNKITDLSTGDTEIKSSTLDPNSFIFKEGIIEFDSISNTCKKGEVSKGSHYQVTYQNEKFNLPEFMSLIKC